MCLQVCGTTLDVVAEDVALQHCSLGCLLPCSLEWWRPHKGAWRCCFRLGILSSDRGFKLGSLLLGPGDWIDACFTYDIILYLHMDRVGNRTVIRSACSVGYILQGLEAGKALQRTAQRTHARDQTSQKGPYRLVRRAGYNGHINFSTLV